MAKNTDKKSFMLYLDSFEQWNILSDEQAGILIKAIFRFAETGEMMVYQSKQSFGYDLAEIKDVLEDVGAFKKSLSFLICALACCVVMSFAALLHFLAPVFCSTMNSK